LIVIFPSRSFSLLSLLTCRLARLVSPPPPHLHPPGLRAHGARLGRAIGTRWRAEFSW
jgi:hypothetical protein